GRYHTAEKRNVHAEVASRDRWLDNVLARGPGPEEVAYLVDQIEELVRGLPSVFAEVLHRRLCGQSVSDVARDLAVSRQGIYEVLKILRLRLEKTPAGARRQLIQENPDKTSPKRNDTFGP